MEEMLGMKMRPPINLQNFLKEYNELLQPDLPQPELEKDIQERMKLLENVDYFESIANTCSLEQIRQHDDPRISKFEPGFTEIFRKNNNPIEEEEIKLKTFENLTELKARSQKYQKNPFKRSREAFKLVQLPRTKDNNKDDCNFYNDLIVSIRIYRPVRATHIGRTLEKPVFAEEFQCLGSNCLTELRDKIACVCNGNRFFDISEFPKASLPIKTVDPGYFFITDTFYNDHRNPDNPDYSQVIRAWAKRAIGMKDLNFKVAPMEQTRFLDLSVSLGFPQLYQHHGNCEHVFVISQVEVITPAAECRNYLQYPWLSSFGVFNNRLCNMCGTLHYVFIVEQGDRHLHDPAYLCKKCFYSYNYVDDRKIGKFRAYRLLDTVETEDLLETEEQGSNETVEENQITSSDAEETKGST